MMDKYMKKVQLEDRPQLYFLFQADGVIVLLRRSYTRL